MDLVQTQCSYQFFLYHARVSTGTLVQKLQTRGVKYRMFFMWTKRIIGVSYIFAIGNLAGDCEGRSTAAGFKIISNL
jgi:hypothetical protein